MAWHMDKEPETRVSPHLHNYYELVYYHTGGGETNIRDTCHVFSPRTCVLICPGTVHDEYHRLAGEVYCIGFRTERPLSPLLLRDSDGLLLRLVRDILAESTRQQQGYQDMIQARLLELAVLLSRTDTEVPVAPKNFEYTVNYIRENYYEKIIFSDLARDLHLSYDYFQHRFKQLMGVSPQRFLLENRLEAASRMLRDSETSCTEIAYRCGFSNSSQFSMLFKREKGMTPFQFRNYEKVSQLFHLTFMASSWYNIGNNSL